MILLDTHVWVWWVQDDKRLPTRWRDELDRTTDALGVSIFSCWEVAKLTRLGRVQLPAPTRDWLSTALSYPSIELLPLSSEIVVQANELPDLDHKDPVDQILIATALVRGCPIMTLDRVIQNYRHVEKFT